jgi:NADH-quinone oxidoreductase subunit G
MSQDNKTDTITIFVDDQPVEVPPGINLIEALALAGKEVPHYCYHPKLSVVGNCRMCMVEMGTPGRDRATGEPMLNEDGSPKIMWVPKPVIGCATNASPGMHVKTESPMVKGCREGVMEFLLVNHPLDCPICDQAGECRLQEFATDYGRGYSRFVEQKNVKPKRTRIGPRVMLDDERCILCSRCIRFSEEIAEDPVLGFIDRGSYTTLTTFPGKELANNYSLNTVDICPVGALTSTDFRFKMRVWFLKETPSIDTESSVGCNTVIGSREGVIHRITPRRNDAVNDTWMPDSGRELYKQVDAEGRHSSYSIDGRPCTPEEAMTLAATFLRNGKCGIVGSGRLSTEEQFLLKKIAEACPGGKTPVWLLARHAEGDGKLLSADRNPNVRGALVTGLIDGLPETNLSKLNKALQSGEIENLLVVGEDISLAGVSVESIRSAQVIYMGSHHCDTSQHANVEIPLLTVFEKSGTFINQQFRVQKFQQAIPGPKGVLFGLSNFVRLLEAISDEPLEVGPSPESIWEAMAREIPEFSDWTFGQIPGFGKLVDARRFDGLAFVEGKSLHYEPAAAPVNSQS